MIRLMTSDTLDDQTDDLDTLIAAAREVAECQRVLTKTGDTLIGDLLRGASFFEWQHYPDGDVYDSEYHAQYYYHAHPADERYPGEHGHFHAFLRSEGMPSGVQPVAPAERSNPDCAVEDNVCHLVAISMDRMGYAIRLFTTNRWVTGESWYSAPDVIRMLDCFRIDHAQPSWPTNRWLSAMLILYRPEIERLLHQRDAAIADWAAKNPGINVLEDRSIEVLSELSIDVGRHVQSVERRWRERRRNAATPQWRR